VTSPRRSHHGRNSAQGFAVYLLPAGPHAPWPIYAAGRLGVLGSDALGSSGLERRAGQSRQRNGWRRSGIARVIRALHWNHAARASTYAPDLAEAMGLPCGLATSIPAADRRPTKTDERLVCGRRDSIDMGLRKTWTPAKNSSRPAPERRPTVAMADGVFRPNAGGVSLLAMARRAECGAW